MQNIIAIENGVTRHPLYRMKEPVNMTLATGERAGRRSNSGHGSSPACQLQTNKYPGRQNVGKNNHSRWKRIQKNICLYVKSTFSGFHR